MLTGGGSGGHITPLLAVAHELKRLKPDTSLIYVGQKGDGLADIPAAHPDIDAAYAVHAGKFRRYHGEGLKQVLDVSTVAKNTRDLTRVVRGLAESRRLLNRLKPDVVFIKGGFVGVPVGLAAAQLHIPFVTHDSDAIPGLANRVIARWASAHAVALPKELYAYPQENTYTVGVPVSEDFVPITTVLQNQYRKALGLDSYKQILLVTGGGNGAQGLNRLVVRSAEDLLTTYPQLAVVHITGRQHTAETDAAYRRILSPELMKRLYINGFVTDLYRYSGAADVIVARGSATNLAEFAVQGKACIMIPAPQLVWTMRNTEAMAREGAVISLSEKELQKNVTPLTEACSQLINNEAMRRRLAVKLSSFAHPEAARELAELLLKAR